MGMLDNIFKNLDDVLKDIEEGGLERRLDNLANMVDKGVKQTLDVTEKVAGAPEKALNLAEEKYQQAEEKVQVIGQKAEVVKRESGKFMDMMPRKQF
ncbi:hypothetical protein EYC59_04125 [Candidatus Saccharibacteria bacterium]|nr:MAG: hypothetical protein EYC59_04125 [Candidatus Saccharibacteria bacterium]